METRFPFELPRGYVDAEERVHRQGVLRLATAADEVAVLGDPRVLANRAYVAVLLLSRVIVELGDLKDEDVTAEVVEGLFSADLAYLQELYRRVNGVEPAAGSCPHCGRDL